MPKNRTAKTVRIAMGPVCRVGFDARAMMYANSAAPNAKKRNAATKKLFRRFFRARKTAPGNRAKKMRGMTLVATIVLSWSMQSVQLGIDTKVIFGRLYSDCECH